MDLSIIGMADSHIEAPEGVEMWGLPWHEGRWIHFDRLFEMHDISLLEKGRPHGYIDRLMDVDVPLYMQKDYFDSAVRYPFEEVISVTGDYFNSSIAYMLALAIAEGYEKIGLYGVDMKAEDEYFYQRPNIEYLIGLAKGRGIEIVLPDECPICKFHGDGIQFGSSYPVYHERYGQLWQ